MLRALRIIVFIMIALGAAPATAQGKVTVLLDWHVNPDHGPLFVALERGYFAARHLHVELIAPSDPNDPPRLVAAKRGDIAVSYQPQLHIQVAKGLPLVRFGTLVDTPLNTLVVLRDGPIKTLADLKGRKIGYSVGGFEEALLSAMLGRHNLTLKDVTLINVNFALSPALMAGQVDAVIGAFRNFELNQMEIEKRPGRAFYPEQNGVPPYDELIFVAHRERLGDTQLMAFLDAVEEAVQTLINDPDESWRLFIKGRAKELDNELNRRAWRDTLPRFAHSPAALDTRRYERFAKFLLDMKVIDNAPPVSNYAVDLGARR